MNNDEDKLKEALDDIFGTDFIDIKTSDNNLATDSKNSTNEISFDDMLVSIEDSLKTDVSVDNQDMPTPIFLNSSKEDQTEENNIPNNLDNPEDSEIKKVTSYETIDGDVSDTDIGKKKSNFKFLIVISIILLIVASAVFFLIKYDNSIEKKEYCYYEATDTGYKNTDSYLITHIGNKITYVEGVYEYIALTDEFKSQIDVIKDEKLAVIINSYGISGYTHMYEISDNSIKINSYYDVLLFDSEITDKNDDKLRPLSYINLKTNTKFVDLKKDLESKGYTCSYSK